MSGPELIADRPARETPMPDVGMDSERGRLPPMPISRAWPGHVLARGAAAASVVVTAAVVTGVVITNSAPAAGKHPAASSEPPSSETTALPSAQTPSNAPGLVAPGAWERIDLPDPAPGTFTSTRASDVVAFNGEYVAVGVFVAYCGSDIHETPPGCEAVLNTLPTTLSAAVWVSEDARTWEQLPLQHVFEGGWMEHAATDGERIVVTGNRQGQGGRKRVAWVSNNARDWQLIGPEELVPEQLVATTEGFIGVRPTEDGPQFVASGDGRSWRPLTDPGELGPGQVFGLAVGRDGVTVTAVGSTYRNSDDGELDITATSWLSRDHVTWERAPANDGQVGAEMIAATETDAGWVAVGVGKGSAMAVWTSPDGLSWTRGGDVAAPYGGPDDIAWTGDQIVATGTVGGDSSSVIAFWLSPDGRTWEINVPDEAWDAGTSDRLAAFEEVVLAVGIRSTGPDHTIGVVWIAGP
jgi:hypothetical protein